MATIYRLVTQLAADPAPMEAGFAQGLASAKRFAASIAPTIASIGNQTGTSAGDRIARNIMDALNKTLKQEQGTITEAFARGSLSPTEFDALGRKAGESFKTAILNTISTLDAKGMLSSKARTQLVDALGDVREAQTAAAAAVPPLIPPKVEEDAENILTRFGTKLRSLGRDLTQVGFEASIIFTAPLVKGAHDAIEAAENLSHAIEGIAVSTGATGPRLDSLRTSFDHLFLNLPNSAKDIGTAIERIAQSTNATGPALDDIATKTLNLSRITGTDLAQNVDSSQRAFKAWGETIDQQSKGLDTLFRVSQTTGTAVGTLAESLGHFAPALRQFGLSFDQSAALIGQFEKNGIDADSVLTTLQTSLSKFAEKGIDGSHALQLLISDLKSAGSEADAVNLASRIFGPRQAAQLASAVRSGALDFQKLTDQVAASASTINKTAATTDTFATAMSRLSHQATLSGAAIGDTLERSFLIIEPVLERVIRGVGSIADAFGKLPTPITLTATLILGTAAAFGPIVLALGGATRAAGAIGLAFGILKQGIAGAALGTATTQVANFSTGIIGATSATSALNAGLTLLGRTAVVGLVVGAIALAIDDLLSASREAAKHLDEFKKSLDGLSEHELTIRTDALRDDLAARQKQIDDLRQSASTPIVSFFDRLGAAMTAEQTGGQTDSQAQQASLENAQHITQQQIALTTEAASKAHEAYLKATQSAKVFQDQVNGLIRSTGTSVTVDPTGEIHGSLEALKNELTGLQSIASKGIPLPGITNGVLDSAIEHLSTTITAIENKGKPGLAAIFDQLSPSIVSLDRQVTALVTRAQGLGGPLEQLGDTRLTAGLLADLAEVNERLAKLGDSTSLDAEKLRAMQKALKDTFAAQIATNPTNSGSFSIDFTAKIDRIDAPADAGQQLLAAVGPGLAAVRNAAEAATAAQLNLQRATATGSIRDIELAGIAAKTAYANAKRAEDDFTLSVANTHAPLAEQRAAFAAMVDEVSKAGAQQEQISLGFALEPDALQTIQNDVAQTLAKLPTPRLGLKVFVDALSLDDATTRITSQLEKSQIQGLSGDRIGAAITRNTAIDTLTRQFHDLAQTMDLQNPSTADLESFHRIQIAAAALGLSLTDLQKRFADLTTTGKIERFADTFARATAAAFGTDSAVAKLTAGLDQGVHSAIDLGNAIESMSKGGGFDSFLDGLSSIGSLVGAIGAIGGALGGFFGKNQLDIEHDNILKSNTDALDALKNSLDREAGTAGRVGALAQATAQTRTPEFEFLIKAAQVANLPQLGQDAFAKILAGFGLTLDQAVASAKSFGVTLEDSKGNLVGLQAFMDALEADAKLITSLGKDFSSQQKLIAAQNAIAGRTSTPASTLADQIDAIAKTAGSTVGDTLKQALAAGPDALRRALAALVTAVSTNAITLDQLGHFDNASDFLDALTEAANDLNGLSGAVGTVTDALLNVPQGFKRALDEFNAQAAITPEIKDPHFIIAGPFDVPGPTDTTPTTQHIDDFTASLEAPTNSLSRLSLVASDVADALDQMFNRSPSSVPGVSSNPVTGKQRFTTAASDESAGSDGVHFHGPVNVNIDAAGLKASDVFDVFTAQLKKKARQITGDSTRVVDALQRG